MHHRGALLPAGPHLIIQNVQRTQKQKADDGLAVIVAKTREQTSKLPSMASLFHCQGFLQGGVDFIFLREMLLYISLLFLSTMVQTTCEDNNQQDELQHVTSINKPLHLTRPLGGAVPAEAAGSHAHSCDVFIFN